MATPPPLLLLLTVLSLSLLSSATPHHPNTNKNPLQNTTTNINTNTSFIWSSCQVTEYPKLCFHCLSPFSSSIHRSPRRLALTALASSLSRARSTARFISSLQHGTHSSPIHVTRHISRHELQAVKDCVDTMGDTVDQLAKSIRELGQMDGSDDFMFHVSNVQTWVSAALTNENTCVEGLYEEPTPNGGDKGKDKIKGAIKMRVNNVAQVTSNALALVNHFADKYEAVFDKIKPRHPKKH